MTVQIPNPPQAATAALTLMIGAHLSRAVAADSSKYTPDLHVPVFVFDQKASINIDDLAHLKPVAWRFVILLKGKPYATGDVTATDGSFELSSVRPGWEYAQKLLTAVSTAQNQAPRDRFELRLLEAPAFHVGALWLHDEEPRSSDVDKDLFSILQGQDSQIASSLIPVKDFVALLNRAQWSKIKDIDLVDYSQEG